MKTKTGGCHCKKITYQVEIDMTQPVIECDCSHCQIKGLLLIFVPQSSMNILSGKHDTTEYYFNTHKITHVFCSICGVEPYAIGAMPDGSPTYAINVRTIDDIQLDKLNRISYDGRTK